MIRPWIFEFFHAPGNPAHDAEPEVASAHFADYLDLWQRAEALGFEHDRDIDEVVGAFVEDDLAAQRMLARLSAAAQNPNM